MSTTRSISSLTPYTIIGEKPRDESFKRREGLSIIILSAGPRPLRESLFNELCKIKALEIISIESRPCPCDAVSLSQRYTNLRFIIFSQELNVGDRINTAVSEAVCNHCLVLSRNMQINTLHNILNVLPNILKREQLCTVPVLLDEDGESLPVAVGPIPDASGRFSVLPTIPGKKETPSLIPWVYCGIYSKEKHESVGGFDPLIQENWWQLLEYGMRAWMWGEKISTHPDFKVNFLIEPPPIDTTPGPGYRRFYLKTLAVHRRGAAERLTLFQWWSYLRNSGDKLPFTRFDWKDISQWVQKNWGRYKIDAEELTEIWQWTDP